jgi:hypothetical protein
MKTLQCKDVSQRWRNEYIGATTRLLRWGAKSHNNGGRNNRPLRRFSGAWPGSTRIFGAERGIRTHSPAFDGSGTIISSAINCVARISGAGSVRISSIDFTVWIVRMEFCDRF